MSEDRGPRFISKRFNIEMDVGERIKVDEETSIGFSPGKGGLYVCHKNRTLTVCSDFTFTDSGLIDSSPCVKTEITSLVAIVKRAMTLSEVGASDRRLPYESSFRFLLKAYEFYSGVILGPTNIRHLRAMFSKTQEQSASVAGVSGASPNDLKPSFDKRTQTIAFTDMGGVRRRIPASPDVPLIPFCITSAGVDGTLPTTAECRRVLRVTKGAHRLNEGESR